MVKENELAKRLVDHFGGRPEAAAAMKVSTETVRLWLIRGLPLEKAVEIEEQSKAVVTGEEILAEKKREARLARRSRATA